MWDTGDVIVRCDDGEFIPDCDLETFHSGKTEGLGQKSRCEGRTLALILHTIREDELQSALQPAATWRQRCFGFTVENLIHLYKQPVEYVCVCLGGH